MEPETTSLQKLAQLLPANDTAPVPSSSVGRGFIAKPTAVPGYVWPTLTVESWPTNSTVLLIEAAGAVGKTAAAQALASALNWPLFRSERAQVGDGSLSGTIMGSLGFTTDYVKLIALGQAGVVVDSLDEAHFRAGAENLLGFIRNILEVSGARIPSERRANSPSIVVFSRSDTAIYVRQLFADEGVPLATLSVDFFSLDSAREFIHSYMDQRFTQIEPKDPSYNIQNLAPIPFRELRDARLQSIAEVIGSADISVEENWIEVQDFLGYAPVLVAIAESLAVKNPMAVPSKLASTKQGELLAEIIQAILQRETGKFKEHLSDRLASSVPADEPDAKWAHLYSESEQCSRLASYAAGLPAPTLYSSGLPQQAQAIYEEAVEAFLPNHPFLKGQGFASVVFADYVYARVSSDTGSAAMLGFDPATLVREVGPFFSRFVSRERHNAAGVPVIPERLAATVISSWTQEADLLRAEFSSSSLLLISDGPCELYCWRSFQSRDKGTQRLTEEIEFEIEDMSGAITIPSGIRSTYITTDSGLVLGDGEKTFAMGPHVWIRAEYIECGATTLRVEPGHRDLPLMSSIGCESMRANNLTKIEADPSTLRVVIDDPHPLLRPHSRIPTRHQFFSQELRMYPDLRTIFLSFRSSVRPGQLAALVAKIDKKIVSGNSRRQSIFNLLIEDKVVSKENQWYLLDQNRLNELGFGFHDFRAGEPSESMLRFLARCRGNA
ncbi:hypothetical protein WBG06_18350 [Nocardioides sp. CCNWLW239]|uniref:hypothetical protein n=1 Tax=Nocardioides sp. CCNWLW239 TaxID=3128902 RepID=UPI0030180663